MTPQADVPRFVSATVQGGGPRVTIAIPTFNRPELLIESIKSAAAQYSDQPFEILVVDNCSDEASVQSVLKYLKYYSGPPLRYYVNETNIGMFGNWNSCLMRAQGEWVTILSDDDLLLPGFLSTMLDQVEKKRVGSLICQALTLDQRAVTPMSPTPRATAIKQWIRGFFRFGLRRRRAVTLKRLFWGNVAGSSLGSLFRTQEALEMGGFDERDYPSADLGLHLKFVRSSGLDQIPEMLCVVRLQANESMKLSTMHGFVTTYYRRRMSMIEAGEVPKAWAWWVPCLLAYEIDVMRKHWGGCVDRAAIEAELGVRIPRRVPTTLMWWIRAVHGGV